jgi:hypothetical protein
VRTVYRDDKTQPEPARAEDDGPERTGSKRETARPACSTVGCMKSEPLSPNQRTRARALVAIHVVLAITLACAFTVLFRRKAAERSAIPVQGPVFLSVIGFTNYAIDRDQYHFAVVSVTNAGSNTVFYIEEGEPHHEIHLYDLYERSGWRSFSSASCASANIKRQLDPLRSITFRAWLVDSPPRGKVQVTVGYWDHKSTWQTRRTAATAVFEFPRGTP